VPELGSYLLIGAVAAVVTFAVTPVVIVVAKRMGWVYLPNDRTVHQTPLPDVGGLAMFVGFVAALATAWMMGSFDVVFETNSEPLGVLLAALVIFAVGFIDDIKEISRRPRCRARSWPVSHSCGSASSCSRSACRSTTGPSSSPMS
jgi:UDP-GlcNAc:undecaprenyl-phosphate GlcNAc-1-phosphate transferase